MFGNVNIQQIYTIMVGILYKKLRDARKQAVRKESNSKNVRMIYRGRESRDKLKTYKSLA